LTSPRRRRTIGRLYLTAPTPPGEYLVKSRQSLSVAITFAFLCSMAPVGAEVVLVPSPHTSLTKTRQLLDALDVRVMLSLDFQQAAGLDERGELRHRQGLVESRLYTKTATRSKNWMEIAIFQGAGEGYDLALYRPADGGPGDGDFDAVVERTKRLLNREKSYGSSEPVVGYEMFQLGYIEADRALSLLKALGYNTIEFSLSSKSKDREKIFESVTGKSKKLPWIIKVVNATKTSLLEENPEGKASTRAAAKTGKNLQGAPMLGGSHLHSTTGGAPEERLLLVYDRNEPEKLEEVVNLLQSHIDVGAQQIVIEALVIEINRTNLQDIGVDFTASKKNASGSFQPTGRTRVGTFTFSRDSFTDFANFRATMEALTERGDAEVLSSPSVLVLNDRQARIQVGRQIPFSKTTTVSTTSTNQIKGIEYFPVGIVLNLRPRIDRKRSEVTLQIETIISSIATESETALGSVELAPIVENRLVESYVRVGDGTPFIIGGLLSTNEQETRKGIPGLSSIPYLGLLFSRQRVETERREVIVVITPHIVPQDTRNFSYLIPKDSDIFDRFDYTLFRNAYRVRDDEVWDLSFIRESSVLQSIRRRLQLRAMEDVMLQRQEPFKTILEGDIPGEDVLVRRMLGDIVGKLDFGREIDLDKLFFFESTEEGNLSDRGFTGLLESVREAPQRAVILTYDASAEPLKGRSFGYPVAVVTDTIVPTDDDGYAAFLRQANVVDGDEQPLKWSIVLANEDHVKHLQQSLILKRVLKLNSKLPQTLQAFQPGLQVLFPSREDMSRRYHLIDGEVAQLFYETSASQYYPAFERIFNRRVSEIEAELEGGRR
jgi:Flp pilus assembly secretin CpaC